MLTLLSLIGIAGSMLVIWKASDGFETASSYLGRNLTDGVRGATINAIGSSLPELMATSVALLFYMNQDGFAFGIGTTAGSAIFNGAVIPALVILSATFAGLITSIKVSKKVVLRDGISLLIAEAVLIMVLSKGSIGWVDGLILISVYVIYITVLFTTMGNGERGETEEYENEFNLTTTRAWGNLAIAVAIITAACWLLVKSCYALGSALDIQVYFISVILAAAATSVPDTIISIKDAKKGNYEDAVSNALGSNIFDICVCLGLPLMIFSLIHGDITISTEYGSVAELRVLLFGMTIVAFFIYLFGKMGKISAYMLLGLYAGFVWYIVSRAYNHEWAVKFGQILQESLSFLNR